MTALLLIIRAMPAIKYHSRIFQQKDIQSILTTLLSDNKVMDYRFVLRDSHPAREFCVQYRETDLDFFNRLTAEEGIFYYFDENSVLVLSDDAASLNNEKAVVLPYNLNHNAQLQEDTVNAFAHNERVRVSHAVLKDYTFKKPYLYSPPSNPASLTTHQAVEWCAVNDIQGG